MNKPFDKILIANRGEIACRIIKTCRRLGIKTVAVYSDADARSLAVSMADEAYPIGPAPSAQSYLVIERIIEVVKKSGAQAVHPGFGFLSENAQFATALAEAGVTFIGPNQHAIAAMGDKIESKKLAITAGVNTVPGHNEALADSEQALALAKQIGCPVMLKASAGGGGKGMRIAWTLDEVVDGFIAAQNEAKSSFADDRVFVEKFIQEPRHIEIQVLGDNHGNIIHLHERECSIQRRHQKVIEEAPSPFLDPQMRADMGAQALALARAVDYNSAGTVEFIVDQARNFYFLEMNTRLQVEHPVTEFITGIDLVEQMIRVAADQPLALTQEQVPLNGWSIEARVYAEDADRGFMPSTGRLTDYQAPTQSAHVRVDTGIDEGSEISMYYDPMIAKLVTHGDGRDAAIESMLNALDSYVIRGVKSNLAFVTDVINQPRFRQGQLSTNFISDVYPDGFNSTGSSDQNLDLHIAAAATAQFTWQARLDQISDQLAPPAPTKQLVLRHGETLSVVEQCENQGVRIAQQYYPLDQPWQSDQALMHIAGKTLQIARQGLGWQVHYRGATHLFQALTHTAAELSHWMPEKQAADMSRYLISPMPGLLLRIAVTPGQTLKAGEELVAVEAMKMENVFTAERDCTVKSILAEVGSSIAADQALIEFEPTAE